MRGVIKTEDNIYKSIVFGLFCYFQSVSGNMFDIWPVAKILLDKLNYKFSKCLH